MARRFQTRARATALAVFAFLALLALLALAGCTPNQQGAPIVDVEQERTINTDLTYPKNPERWAYVSARVESDPQDRFPGFRVVVANPFAARVREEGRSANRGIKLAQFVYEAKGDAASVGPGELRRVNLIVHDPERYAETGGWGFASFEGNGRPIPVNPRSDCVSCHANGPATPYLPRQ